MPVVIAKEGCRSKTGYRASSIAAYESLADTAFCVAVQSDKKIFTLVDCQFGYVFNLLLNEQTDRDTHILPPRFCGMWISFFCVVVLP